MSINYWNNMEEKIAIYFSQLLTENNKATAKIPTRVTPPLITTILRRTTTTIPIKNNLIILIVTTRAIKMGKTKKRWELIDKT